MYNTTISSLHSDYMHWILRIWKKDYVARSKFHRMWHFIKLDRTNSYKSSGNSSKIMWLTLWNLRYIIAFSRSYILTLCLVIVAFIYITIDRRVKLVLVVWMRRQMWNWRRTAITTMEGMKPMTEHHYLNVFLACADRCGALTAWEDGKYDIYSI